MNRMMTQNIFLVMLAFGSLVYFGVDYFVSVQRMNCVYRELDADFEHLESLIEKAETIVVMKRPLPQYEGLEDYRHRRRNDWSWDDFYEDITLRNEHAADRLSKLESGSSIYLSRFILEKDFISNEIYFGAEGFEGFHVNSKELYVNEEKVKMNGENEYILPYADDLEIEIRKYTLDWCADRIDTTILTRKISLE